MTIQSPGTNKYFNPFNCPGEQDLLEDLVIESIKIFGLDMYYLPRTLISYDQIYGEDDISEYNQAIPIELYIKSVDGFEGDGVFFSKFGLEIRDQITFTMARKTFEQLVVNQPRPFESDLIYYPLNKKLFQIRFVNYLPVHYPLGDLQSYDVMCELFEYSNERLNTGIVDIDELQTEFTTNILDYSIVDENGNYVIDENGNYLISEIYVQNVANTDTVFSDNTAIGDEAVLDDILNWEETDPFSEGFYE